MPARGYGGSAPKEAPTAPTSRGANQTFDPDWVVHPGATLREWFEENGLPLRTARRYGIDRSTLNGLFDGSVEIDEELAQRLSDLTGVNPRFWLAYEHNFRVGLAAGKHWDADG
jgi:plasmid maintenance system antidote protein VapI